MAYTSPQAGSERDHMDLTVANLHKLLTSPDKTPICATQHKGPGTTMERWLQEPDKGFTSKARDRQRGRRAQLARKDRLHREEEGMALHQSNAEMRERQRMTYEKSLLEKAAKLNKLRLEQAVRNTKGLEIAATWTYNDLFRQQQVNEAHLHCEHDKNHTLQLSWEWAWERYEKACSKKDIDDRQPLGFEFDALLQGSTGRRCYSDSTEAGLKKFFNDKQLTELEIKYFPFWPSRLGCYASCTEAAVREFFAHRPADFDYKAFREQVRRWNPDRAMALFANAKDQDAVRNKLAMVTRVIVGVMADQA
jgi:hypothetical protein